MQYLQSSKHSKIGVKSLKDSNPRWIIAELLHVDMATDNHIVV